MKLTNISAELISTGESSLEGAKKIIEISGRTCYKSLDRITEDSADRFVKMMIKSSHTAMLEHGTIYLKIPVGDKFVNIYKENPYSKVIVFDEYAYVTTNYRVIVENTFGESLKYITHYVEGKHEPRITVKIITNLQVLGEHTRHRASSFAVESSRYCNYSKDKFGTELTFIKPNFLNYKDSEKAQYIWTDAMRTAEENYMKLSQLGLTAQECAQVLPKATKVEMIVTANLNDWKHFFDLRYKGTTGKPHPQMYETASCIYKALTDAGFEFYKE